jgi:hypothetical protein
MRRWHVCGADYTGIHCLRHEPAARLNFEPPGSGYLFVANRFQRGQQAGNHAGMVPEMILNRGVKRPTVTFRTAPASEPVPPAWNRKVY